MPVFGFEVWIEACCDECGHVEGLADVCASPTDEALAFPLTGLSGDRSEAGERCGLLVFEGSQFGHGDDELVGSEGSDTIDAGEDLVPSGHCRIGGDDPGDLGIEGFDVAGDLIEALFALPLEDRNGEILFAVLERSAIAHQAVAGVDQLGKFHLLLVFRRSDRRLQRGCHAGKHGRIDPVGLRECAGGLGEAAGAFRVELDAWQVRHRSLQRTVICPGRLIGDTFDIPLSEPGQQRLVALGCIGEPPVESGGVGVAIERCFGDVDADGLWYGYAHLFRCPMLVIRAESPGIRSGLMEKKGAILL